MSPYQPVEQPPDLGHRQGYQLFVQAGTAPFAPGPPGSNAWRLTTARQACRPPPSIARVMCRYQPSHFRTSTGPDPPLPWPPQSILRWSNEFRPPAPVPPESYQPGRSRRNGPTPRAWRCCAGPAASTPARISSGAGAPSAPNRIRVRCTRGPGRRRPRCAAPSRVPPPQAPAGPPAPVARVCYVAPTGQHGVCVPSPSCPRRSPPATAAGCGRCRRLRPQ